MNSIIITETGCYLDNHRGHYIGRDMIWLAEGYGFIVGQFEQFALAMYEDHGHEENFPHEGMTELADAALEWLNSGQTDCVICKGSGIAPEGGDYFITVGDSDGIKRCRNCSGTGRGSRIEFQNFPPIIPEGTAWDWNDGDFGLYSIEDDLLG